MRSKCSDDIYYRSKDLIEDRYDLMERINVFYSKRKDLQQDIEKEKDNDPSDEIVVIEAKVQQCDPMIGFMHPDSKRNAAAEKDINRTKTTENNVNFCKYHTNGFCKRGPKCNYFHQNEDCKEYIETGNCLIVFALTDIG